MHKDSTAHNRTTDESFDDDDVIETALRRAVAEAMEREARLSGLSSARQFVIDAIHVAFGHIRRTGSIGIHEAEAVDDHADEREMARARALDTHQRWQEIPVEDIEACPCAFPYLSRKSFRFYLPAYMCWALRADNLDCPSFGGVIYGLGYNGVTDLNGLSRHGMLDERQSRAVALFLSFYADDGDDPDKDAAEALRACWHQFQ